ncbi:MAG: chemotaxis response regulator protein-glutamate methylesterase [Clostridiales Family XIII bacterium]|jgi:two-component system chemotaxis response regulator CheB|nr:chemotaxis response regulator protein-glutamate methylesterase [Clostridiales Family XIII bacterium]
MEKIRLMVVDDSLLFRELVAKGYEKDDCIEVVGFAADPFEAKDRIPKLAPQVLLLDVEMPRMDGIKFLRNLMPQYPLPVIVISSLAVSVFEALDAGALDFIAKPASVADQPAFLRELKDKVLAASTARFAFRRRVPDAIELSAEGVAGAVDASRLIAIGASTGGTDAITSILTKYSANMPGIVVAQHMPSGFTKMFAQRLDAACHLTVREARDGDAVEPGTALIAPGGLQMEVVREGTPGAGGCYRVRCRESAPVNGHRPAVDVLFGSVAEAAGPRAIGVLLTGMGVDGAAGLKRILDAGGRTIGQDERSSVVYGMPMAAWVMGAVQVQLPLFRIADEILRMAQG